MAGRRSRSRTAVDRTPVVLCAAGRDRFAEALSEQTVYGASSTLRAVPEGEVRAPRGKTRALLDGRDIDRATLTAEAEYGRLQADDRLALLPEARSDRYSRLAIGASFRQLTFGGFAPFTRLVIERNRSTVEFYDYRRRRSEVGISRAF